MVAPVSGIVQPVPRRRVLVGADARVVRHRQRPVDVDAAVARAVTVGGAPRAPVVPGRCRSGCSPLPSIVRLASKKTVPSDMKAAPGPDTDASRSAVAAGRLAVEPVGPRSGRSSCFRGSCWAWCCRRSRTGSRGWCRSSPRRTDASGRGRRCCRAPARPRPKATAGSRSACWEPSCSRTRRPCRSTWRLRSRTCRSRGTVPSRRCSACPSSRRRPEGRHGAGTRRRPDDLVRPVAAVEEAADVHADRRRRRRFPIGCSPPDVHTSACDPDGNRHLAGAAEDGRPCRCRGRPRRSACGLTQAVGVRRPPMTNP